MSQKSKSFATPRSSASARTARPSWPSQPVTRVRLGARGTTSLSIGGLRAASETVASASGIGHWMLSSGSARFTKVYVFLSSRDQWASTR